MPSLNTLRTKGGVIVTAVIFLALLAFIFSDISGLFGNRKMNVGEINGKKIDYVEFYNTSEYLGNIFKMMWGRDALSAQEQEGVYDETWNSLIMQYSYKPGFDKLGIKVSGQEQVDMLNGVYLSPVITQTFMNPQTGMYDSEMMKMFLQNVSYDSGAQAIWDYLKMQMVDNRATTKFMALASAGFFVNDLEMEEGLSMSSNRYEARLVTKNYSSVADSLVNVSSNEIRNYYNSHKERFKREESRDIEYVVIDVLPSPEDYADAAREVEKLAEEFRTVDAPMQYATLNTQERTDTRYYKELDLSPDLAAIAFGRNAGDIFGPDLKGDTYTISRLADIRMMPDSIGAKHILLEKSEKKLADSLVNVIRQGSNFATLAQEYSIDQSAMNNGGDLGRFAPDQMVPEFSNAVIDARVGQVLTAESQFGLHVIEVTYKSPMVRKAQIATITYKVDPSAATMQAAYQRASNLVTAAGGTLQGFRDATSAEALPRRNAYIRHTDRSIGGFEYSKELIRWAYNGKQGEVSSILEMDGDYVVAAITAVREGGYAPVEDVASEIRSILVREAKGKMIAEEAKGLGLEELAARFGTDIVEATDIDPASFFVGNIGMEMKLIGAIPSVPLNKISKPVTGTSGVYVFIPTAAEPVEPAPTREDEKIRLEASSLYMVPQRTAQALVEESDIKDMRIRFF